METSLAKMSIPIVRSFIQVRRRSSRSETTRSLHIAALPFSPPLPSNKKQTHTFKHTHNTHAVCCFESHRRHPPVKRLLLSPCLRSLIRQVWKKSVWERRKTDRVEMIYHAHQVGSPCDQEVGSSSSSNSSGAGMDAGKVRVERRTHLGENYTPLRSSVEQQGNHQALSLIGDGIVTFL